MPAKRQPCLRAKQRARTEQAPRSRWHSEHLSAADPFAADRSRRPSGSSHQQPDRSIWFHASLEARGSLESESRHPSCSLCWRSIESGWKAPARMDRQKRSDLRDAHPIAAASQRPSPAAPHSAFLEKGCRGKSHRKTSTESCLVSTRCLLRSGALFARPSSCKPGTTKCHSRRRVSHIANI